MALSLISGLILGVIFFGGLWLTVKKAVAGKNTALWLAGSSIIRIAIVLIGFYYVSDGSWQRMLLCVAGFIAARLLLIWVTRIFDQRQIDLNKSGQP
jgi:F1F0 ATPase subunit 2